MIIRIISYNELQHNGNMMHFISSLQLSFVFFLYINWRFLVVFQH